MNSSELPEQKCPPPLDKVKKPYFTNEIVHLLFDVDFPTICGKKLIINDKTGPAGSIISEENNFRIFPLRDSMLPHSELQENIPPGQISSSHKMAS